MSTILVQPLTVSLSQAYELNSSDRVHVGAFIPYLYLHNSPSGTFTMTVTGPNGSVMAKSFTSADIKAASSTPNNYLHTYYSLVPTNPVQIEAGEYLFTLTSSGYSYSESSFIGWAQQFEDIQNELGYIPAGDESNPLTIRFKQYKEGIL